MQLGLSGWARGSTSSDELPILEPLSSLGRRISDSDLRSCPGSDVNSQSSKSMPKLASPLAESKSLVVCLASFLTAI